MDKIKRELEKEGFDYAVAIATEAEIGAGAACGQLSLLVEEDIETAPADRTLCSGL